MKVLYSRRSSATQNISRQIFHKEDYQYTIEDTCSGAIALFEREGGKNILKLIESKVKFTLCVHTIDRLGRDLQDILKSIKFLTENNIPVFFITQGLCTMDLEGNEDAIAKLMIGILGTVAEMERSQIRERQMEGIRIAKLKGAFLGRKSGTKEDVHKFLSKPKNQKTLEYLKKGYSHTDISKIVGINLNTITKIKRLGIISK